MSNARPALDELLNVPGEEREGEWYKEYFSLLPAVHFVPAAEEFEPTGVGFQHARYSISEPGGRALSCRELIAELRAEGLGLLVTSGEATGAPITFSGVWQFDEFGEFLDAWEYNERLLELAGNPSSKQHPKFLPDYLLPKDVRQRLKRFLEARFEAKEGKAFATIDPKQEFSHVLTLNVPNRFVLDEESAWDVLCQMRWFVPLGIDVVFLHEGFFSRALYKPL
ncbi:MAG: hypothetical protein KDD44_08775 [Bdellovibrionales bacterium]|nr:hypothetical protein [Bdellovibrionales bacterium]